MQAAKKVARISGDDITQQLKELAPSGSSHPAWFKENWQKQLPCVLGRQRHYYSPELCNKVALMLCHLLWSQGWKQTVRIPSPSKPRLMSVMSLFSFFVINWAGSAAFCSWALEYAGSRGEMYFHNFFFNEGWEKQHFSMTLKYPFKNIFSSG